jgi:hypothetical protein
VPQDRETGAKASKWGHRMAELIAREISALGMRKTSNECKLGEERIVIKCANIRTQSVGVTYRMLERLDRIVAAFRLDDGSFELWALSPAEFRSAMRESRTSAGKTGLVERAFFERHGKSLGRVRVGNA